MDPNETLKQIDDFLAAHKCGEEVDEWCEYLMDWMDKGGFEPHWEAYPLGTSYYKCRVVSVRKSR